MSRGRIQHEQQLILHDRKNVERGLLHQRIEFIVIQQGRVSLRVAVEKNKPPRMFDMVRQGVETPWARQLKVCA
jgi:hypothetical protein